MKTLSVLETVLQNETVPVILLKDGKIDMIYNIPHGAVVINTAHADDVDQETTVSRYTLMPDMGLLETPICLVNNNKEERK